MLFGSLFALIPTVPNRYQSIEPPAATHRPVTPTTRTVRRLMTEPRGGLERRSRKAFTVAGRSAGVFPKAASTAFSTCSGIVLLVVRSERGDSTNKRAIMA